MINGVTVRTYIATTIAGLPTGTDLIDVTAVPIKMLLSGKADGYQFRFKAVGGVLTFAGATALAIYDRTEDVWVQSVADVGLEAEVILDDGLSMFSIFRSIDGRMIGLVMPGLTDAGSAIHTVTERFESAVV